MQNKNCLNKYSFLYSSKQINFPTSSGVSEVVKKTSPNCTSFCFSSISIGSVKFCFEIGFEKHSYM